MGYDVVKFEVTGRVSRHNAPEDKQDDEAWERLQREVDLLIDADPDYRRVTLRDY